jgi:hypothetical protein
MQQKGTEGIAQFMPATASWHGLSDPFDPIASFTPAAVDPADLPKDDIYGCTAWRCGSGWQRCA